ncbi:MAG: type 1 glutamine amidotransferase [Candidatus Saccharimonadales bacterium]
MAHEHKQPVIGIVPSFDDGFRIPYGGGDIKRIYIRHEYMAMIVSIGAVPIVLSPEMTMDVIMELCDGIVISGGEDIEPQFYNAEPIPTLRPYEPARRFVWEKSLIEACDEAGKSILGICYGMQRLNVHYGGTLIQDIPTFYPDNVGHDIALHDLTFQRDFLGMKSTGVHRINSRHHQAVDRIAEGFVVSAVAKDGIIEAMEGHGHFGMQWHPESDETGAHVYRAFVEHCMRNWIS